MKTQTRFFFLFFQDFQGIAWPFTSSQETNPLKGSNAPRCWEHWGKKLAKRSDQEITFWEFIRAKKNTTVEWDYFPGSKHLEWERRNCNGKFWARKMPLGKWVRINGKKWEFFIHWGNEESKNDRLEICLLTSEELQCASQLWRNCKFAYTDLPSVTVTKYLTPATCKERSLT